MGLGSLVVESETRVPVALVYLGEVPEAPTGDNGSEAGGKAANIEELVTAVSDKAEIHRTALRRE